MAYFIPRSAKNITEKSSIMNRFLRLEKLIGKDSLENLAQKKVAIIGCGGVGGYVIESFARSAIGTLILIDYDVVEDTNLNRQLVATNSTIGLSKVSCYQERVHNINQQCNVILYQEKLTANNIDEFITDDVDYVVDACDDTKAKEAILTFCIMKHIPFISCMGTGNRFDPSKLEIMPLNKTQNDPLARRMRHFVKEHHINQKIMVCCSTEVPIKTDDNTIASIVVVPATAGLLIASYVLNQLLTNNEKK